MPAETNADEGLPCLQAQANGSFADWDQAD